jgi:hypothetical protein
MVTSSPFKGAILLHRLWCGGPVGRLSKTEHGET